MGLGSKLKKAVGGLIQKVHKSDPVFNAAMKYDPLAKRAFEDHFGPLNGGRVASQPAAQQPIYNNMPVRNDAGWQMQRVAAMRQRFGRPGGIGTSSMPVAPSPGVKTRMPVVAKPSAPVADVGGDFAVTMPYTTPDDISSRQPGVMAASPIASAPALNPVAQDTAAYSQAWQTLA